MTRIAAHGCVVVAAHGSKDPAGLAVVREVVDELRVRLPGRSVLLALALPGPGVREVVADVPGPVTVVPAFLSCGYHFHTDVPREVAATGRGDVTISAALGPHPLLVDAVADRLRAAGWRRGDAVVLAAVGSAYPKAMDDVCVAARQLSDKVDSQVRVGFVATGAPRVVPLVAELRAAGESRVAVVSWVLAPGLFYSTILSTGADVVSAPLGAHPEVVNRLVQLAEPSV